MEDWGNNTRPSVGLTLVFFIQHLDGLRSEHKDAERPSLSPFAGEFAPRLKPAVRAAKRLNLRDSGAK